MGQKDKSAADGLFMAIGHDPASILFKGQLETDDKGYISVKDRTRTSIDGVFAAGDVKDYRYRQAVTAADQDAKLPWMRKSILVSII